MQPPGPLKPTTAHLRAREYERAGAIARISMWMYEQKGEYNLTADGAATLFGRGSTVLYGDAPAAVAAAVGGEADDDDAPEPHRATMAAVSSMDALWAEVEALEAAGRHTEAAELQARGLEQAKAVYDSASPMKKQLTVDGFLDHLVEAADESAAGRPSPPPGPPSSSESTPEQPRHISSSSEASREGSRRHRSSSRHRSSTSRHRSSTSGHGEAAAAKQREEGLAAAVMRERIKQRESEAAGGETRERSSSRRSRRSQVEA